MDRNEVGHLPASWRLCVKEYLGKMGRVLAKPLRNNNLRGRLNGILLTLRRLSGIVVRKESFQGKWPMELAARKLVQPALILGNSSANTEGVLLAQGGG